MGLVRIGKFTVVEDFSEKIATIRTEGDPTNSSTFRDEFDEKNCSQHLILEIENGVAAYQRFTHNFSGAKTHIEVRTMNDAPVPKSFFFNMDSLIIKKEFKQTAGLFESLMMMSLLYAKSLGFSKAVIFICENKDMVKRCEALGFELKFKPSIYKQSTACHHTGRTLIFDIDNEKLMNRKFSESCSELMKQQIKLDFSFLRTIPRIVPSEKKIIQINSRL